MLLGARTSSCIGLVQPDRRRFLAPLGVAPVLLGRRRSACQHAMLSLSPMACAPHEWHQHGGGRPGGRPLRDLLLLLAATAREHGMSGLPFCCMSSQSIISGAFPRHKESTLLLCLTAVRLSLVQGVACWCPPYAWSRHVRPRTTCAMPAGNTAGPGPAAAAAPPSSDGRTVPPTPLDQPSYPPSFHEVTNYH